MVSQLHDVLIARADIGDVPKAKMAERIAQCDKALIDGSDEELQLLDVAATCMQLWARL
jgi:replication factor C subunit 2/4